MYHFWSGHICLTSFGALLYEKEEREVIYVPLCSSL